MQSFSLNGKVAVVTGAARGNGKAIADGLLEAGATVYYVDQLRDELNEVVDDPRAKTVCADLTVRSQLDAVIPSIIEQEGRIDVLVNNAGITKGGTSSEAYAEEDWDQTHLINLKVPFVLSQAAAKAMIASGRGGSIINITSLGAELGFSNNPAYVASKGGLKQLTKAFAKDWAKYGIRVNNLVPGYVRTNMTKKSFGDPILKKERDDRIMLPRWAESQDLAGPVVFLASDASSYVTGHDLHVDGGWLANGI